MNTRKISIIMLTLVLCCALSLPALAASGTITDITTPIDKNITHNTTSVQPGKILEYPLSADMFSWSVTPGVADEPVTLTQLRQSNITVKYSIAQSQVIEDVTLATTTYKGQTTACIKVEFAEAFASVNKREFKLSVYLAMGNTRKDASAITLYGDFENEEVSVDSGDDYVTLGVGKVLIANANLSNLEIDMGKGVQLFARVSSGKRYYAAADDTILDSDDAMLQKHPEIENIIRLKTINLAPTGKCVSLNDIGSYHAYNASGVYLGQTDELVAFSELYYLSSAEIDMDNGSSDESGDAEKDEDKPKSPFGNTPEEKAAIADMADAAREAAKSGSDTANVHVKDVEGITAAELQAMFDAASAAGLKSQYTADTMSPSGSVEGRIIINPALAVKLPGDIQLGVYTRSSKTGSILLLFNRLYKNKIAVVSLTQKETYWMPVSIAAKVDLDGMNTKNLYFYSYDRVKGKINRVVNPRYYIDSKGYLRFTAILACEIIISDGALAKL